MGKTALVVGVLALVLCVMLGLGNPVQFFRSYLLAFVFWIGLPLGCGAILMIHYMIGGKWGFPLRRPLESGTKTFLLMAVLVLPILFRLPILYSWADPAKVQADPLLQYKHPYLNVPFFIIRTAIYFAAWFLIAYYLIKWSHQQDQTGEAGLTTRLRQLSAPGLLIFGLTITFACIDWVMSLEPQWYSTIYGMIFMMTECLAAMSLMTLTAIRLSKNQSMGGMVTPTSAERLWELTPGIHHVVGVSVVFSIFDHLGGGYPGRNPMVYEPGAGGWAVVAVILIIFHFAVPFLLLLSRFVKRRGRLLGCLAAGLIVVSVVDIFWLTVPAFERRGPEFHLTDWLAIIGIGGLWLWRFTSQLQGRPLLPLHDPRLKELMQHA